MAINTSESIYEPKERKKKSKALPEVSKESDTPQVSVPSAIDVKGRWPKDEIKSIESIFGRISDGDYEDDGRLRAGWESSYLRLLDLSYPMRLAWDPNVLIRKIACNAAVYKSLATILDNIWNFYGKDLKAVQAARMDLFGGCYNFRPRRGGHRLSLHAWGAAIDINPQDNPIGKPWEDGKNMIPKEVIQLFLNEGWTWGGTFSNPDAMHFQACSET